MPEPPVDVLAFGSLIIVGVTMTHQHPQPVNSSSLSDSPIVITDLGLNARHRKTMPSPFENVIHLIEWRCHNF